MAAHSASESASCRSGISLDISGGARGFKIYQKGKLLWSEVQGEFFTSDSEVKDFCAKAKLFPKRPERIVALSSTYLPWLEDLNLLGNVVGISSKAYVANKQIHEAVTQEKVSEVGLPASAERILGLRPDVVITYRPIDREIEGTQKLSSLGLKVLELSEFDEAGPLARGSWLLFLAATLGEHEDFLAAQKLWQQRFDLYQAYKEKAHNFEKVPVIVGNITENAWSAPPARSDLVQLIEDARGEYVWLDLARKDSGPHALKLSFEKVLQTSKNASVWLTQNQWTSLTQGIQEDSRYKILPMLKKGRVYNYSKNKQPGFGFDYWETGVARPDLMLRDLILILHPSKKKFFEIDKNKDTLWYQKLE